MLSPEYLWSIADSVVNIYDEMNKWSIEDIAERIMKAELYNYSGLPGTARFRAWLLNQSGEHYEKMALQLSVLTKKADSEIMKLFIDAGLTAIDNDFAPYNKEPYNLKKDPVDTQILQAAYDQTKGELHNYTRTTLDESNKLLINNMDRAYFEVSTGQKSYSEAITDAIKEVSNTGSTVRYRTGHVDTIEVAVRRAVMTGVNQGACKVSLHNCELLGAEYVIIDAHMGARYNENNKIANHMGWQGKVYKLNGSDQYPNLEEETGFPSDPLGLAGYNCRHSFYAFFPGIDNPDKFKDIVTDEEESKRQYDMSQKQRKFERDIRKSKDLLVGYETAIDHCKDEQTKFELQMMYDRASAKLQKQNKVYNEFCKDNDLQKEYDRIKTAKWNREQSRKAMSGAHRYNDISKLEKNSGNDWSETQPRVVANEEKEAVIEYGKEKGIKIVNVSKFDGDIELAKAQINSVYETQSEYKCLSNKQIYMSFDLLDNDDFAVTQNRTITINTKALRDRKITENNINKQKGQFASVKLEDIAKHEMGHMISNVKGNIGVELLGKAYYNIYKENISFDDVLKFLECKVSEYSTNIKIYNAYKITPRKFKEIIPEVIVADKYKKDKVLKEFIRLLKEE